MNAYEVKKKLIKFNGFLNFNYPAIGWYFSDEKKDGAFEFKSEKWVCMFMYINICFKKERAIVFSGNSKEACRGPAEYFGFSKFSRDGSFITDEERFKKTSQLGRDYYKEIEPKVHTPKCKYLYMEKLENIEDSMNIEVINFFPDISSLVSLSVLSHYDRSTNFDNVITPFVSGCQSLFTIPMDEGLKEKPASVIGLFDPYARKYIPKDIISFSIPVNRFFEFHKNIDDSFLTLKN